MATLGVIAVFTLFGFVIYKFNAHCEDKFEFKLFTMQIFATLGVASGLFLWGKNWYLEAIEVNDRGRSLMGIIINNETTNGAMLMAFAILILLGIILQNFVRTNWQYGVFGTLIQLGIMGFIGHFGLMVLAIYILMSFYASLERWSN